MFSQLAGIVQLQIEDFTTSGEGIGRAENLVYFVPAAVPGDLIEAKPKRPRKNYIEADLLNILKPSPFRRQPACPVFNLCGGCQLQHFDYQQQLLFKAKRLEGALRRIAGLKNSQVSHLVGMANPWRYRNKLTFKINQTGKIGFYRRQSHQIVPITDCLLADQVMTKVASFAAQEFLSSNPIEIIVRSSLYTKELLLKITMLKKPIRPEQFFLKIQSEFPLLKGITLCRFGERNPKKIISLGATKITENIAGLKLLISADSFFQINSRQAEGLYQTAIKLAESRADDLVIDAFCGIGGFGLVVAKQAKHVFGLEKNLAALKDAIENAKLNKLSNITFKQADLEKSMPAELKPFYPQIDLLIVDPPRQGLSQALLENLKIMIGLKKILYVSCDPATFCRDLNVLLKLGFKPYKFIAFDLFPQTTHLEIICLLINEKNYP